MFMALWVFLSCYTVSTIFWISNFFGMSITEETLFVKMCICWIKIGIVLVLHFNPLVEASADGL
jgi:hypothetical protein